MISHGSALGLSRSLMSSNHTHDSIFVGPVRVSPSSSFSTLLTPSKARDKNGNRELSSVLSGILLASWGHQVRRWVLPGHVLLQGSGLSFLQSTRFYFLLIIGALWGTWELGCVHWTFLHFFNLSMRILLCIALSHTVGGVYSVSSPFGWWHP